MGFGHRVYRAYDPRAAALRDVARGMAGMADWLEMAVAVEDVVLRVLAEMKPDRVIKTNVEFYAAAVLQGVGLPPDLFAATFALARHAGWTAHVLEQAGANRLIRPDVRYVGPAERPLPVTGVAAGRFVESGTGSRLVPRSEALFGIQADFPPMPEWLGIKATLSIRWHVVHGFRASPPTHGRSAG